MRHLLLVLMLLVMSCAVPAQAATITVTTSVDELNADGHCSLREAITAATTSIVVDTCAAGGDTGTDEIIVPAGTYTLAVGELTIANNIVTKNLIIRGAGADTTTIQACTVDQKTAACPPGQGIADVGVFAIGPDTSVTISGVTIRNGRAGSYGGGIVNSGTLTVTNSTITSNISHFHGGGIVNFGTLTVSNSSVLGNTSPHGGGIFQQTGGTFTLVHSIVGGNRVGGNGGGIYNERGTLTVAHSVIDGNTAISGGGGIISVHGGTTTLTNSTVSNNSDADVCCRIASGGAGILNGGIMELTNVTVSGNTISTDGGGVSNFGVLVVTNSTLTNNTAGRQGGGIYSGFDTVTIKNTIIGGNTARNSRLDPSANDDCFGTLTSAGYNLIQTLSANCTISGDSTGNITGVNPNLGPLQHNGGPTQTHALLVDSQAIDAGSPDCPAPETDQRGIRRPQGHACDIGAFEVGVGFSVLAISPDKGGDTGSASALIHGSDFMEGATVKLAKVGEPDIIGNPVNVREDGRTISTTFDLAGKARGARDVVITARDGVSVTLPGGFTIEAGTAPRVWVDILGRDRIRAGREATFHIVYGNRGNVDAIGVPLQIAGIPKDAPVKLAFNVQPPPNIAPSISFDFATAPRHIERENDIMLPLLIPLIPPGFTGTLSITLSPGSAQSFSLRAGVSPPIFQSPPSEDATRCIAELGFIVANLPPAVDCIAANLGFWAGLILNVALTKLGEEGTSNLWWLGANIVAQCAGEVGLITTFGLSELLELGADFVNLILTAASCNAAFNPLFSEVERPVQVVRSIDPNDKAGSQGKSALRYLSADEPLRYTIFFENVESASAPAQEVTITDTLDVSKVDLRACSLGPIAFGDKQILPPPGSCDFAGDFDLRPEMNLILRVHVSLNNQTGLLAWRFTSIDPATGQLPEDPLAGFLPPNRTPPEGEGNVAFTIMPKPGVPTGAEIRNRASIVFDVNPPIETPEWLNTLDSTKPSSQVGSIHESHPSSALNVQWSGTDVGSGIKDFTVFVSEDGGPFTPWLTNSAATTGTFTGVCGRNYRFYSVARDNTGNVEDPPTAPDAVAAIANCDLAVTKITAPRTVTLAGAPVTQQVTVEIQNRGSHNELIKDMATLDTLVSLTVESLGNCVAPGSALRSGKPQRALPLTLKPMQRLNVVFDVTFSCANDSSRGLGHGDYRLRAEVNRAALGSADAHPQDDTCPRVVAAPGSIHPGLRRTFLDKGCGTRRADGTLGDPVLVDMVVKPSRPR